MRWFWGSTPQKRWIGGSAKQRGDSREARAEGSTWFMASVQTFCIPGNQSGAGPALVRRLSSWLFGLVTRDISFVLALLALRPAKHMSLVCIKKKKKKIACLPSSFFLFSVFSCLRLSSFVGLR